ncbi:MAG: diguanylate cyclase, partial [Alphaproteobacteria bacterium]|nr:diguanylate cyclase [Alphaproteobacteria bacterium]
NDYLIRPVDRNEMLARVRTQVRRKRLQDRLHENYRRSLSLALTDELTGLYNRRYVVAHIEELVARFNNDGAPETSVMMFDVDDHQRRVGGALIVDPPYQLFEMRHDVAPVVEAGQFVGQRQRQAAPVVLVQPVLQALAANLGAHTRQHLVAVDRADQIVVGAEVEPLGEARQFALVGKQQDRQLAERLDRAPLRHQAQRVAVGHRQAEDDQLDRFVEHRLGLVAAADLTHALGDRRQRLGNARGAKALLLDEQDVRAAHRLGVIALLFLAEPAADLFAQPQFFHHPLEPDQRADAREQRNVVDRLGEKIVGPGLEPAQPVGDVGQRGHHHHRDVGGARIGLEPAAHLEPVHPRHHHVEQDDVGQFGFGELQRGGSVERRNHLEILARQLGFEQLDVQFDVVNDEDAGGHS